MGVGGCHIWVDWVVQEVSESPPIQRPSLESDDVSVVTKLLLKGMLPFINI